MTGRPGEGGGRVMKPDTPGDVSFMAYGLRISALFADVPLLSSVAVPKQTILIVANEEVISALLGAMVELDGHVPVFPAHDERPLAAVARYQPSLLLLDCEHDLAWDEAAMRRIGESETRTLLFSAMRSQREIEIIADRYGVPAFVLPVAFREFTDRVESLLDESVPTQRALGA